MDITIDLKNRPDTPFDFPHRCFELSYRIRSLLEVLALGGPWGKDEKSLIRRPAQITLRGLIQEVKGLLSTEPSSPYDQVWEKILPQDEYGSFRRPRDREHMFPSRTWVDRIRLPSESYDDETTSKLLEDFSDLPRQIDSVGLYMLRVIQASGQSLPDEVVVPLASPPE